MNKSVLYKEKLEGPWLVEEFQIEGKDVFWEEIAVQSLTFADSGFVTPPVRYKFTPIDLTKHSNCKWKIIRINGVYKIVIYESKDELFNDTFAFNIQVVSSNYRVLTLKSNRIYMKCT